MFVTRVCLGKVAEVYSVQDPLGNFDGIFYETDDNDDNTRQLFSASRVDWNKIVPRAVKGNLRKCHVRGGSYSR